VVLVVVVVVVPGNSAENALVNQSRIFADF
jgi:signal peptidase I